MKQNFFGELDNDIGGLIEDTLIKTNENRKNILIINSENINININGVKYNNVKKIEFKYLTDMLLTNFDTPNDNIIEVSFKTLSDSVLIDGKPLDDENDYIWIKFMYSYLNKLDYDSPHENLLSCINKTTYELFTSTIINNSKNSVVKQLYHYENIKYDNIKMEDAKVYEYDVYMKNYENIKYDNIKMEDTKLYEYDVYMKNYNKYY